MRAAPRRSGMSGMYNFFMVQSPFHKYLYHTICAMTHYNHSGGNSQTRFHAKSGKYLLQYGKKYDIFMFAVNGKIAFHRPSESGGRRLQASLGAALGSPGSIRPITGARAALQARQVRHVCRIWVVPRKLCFRPLYFGMEAYFFD